MLFGVYAGKILLWKYFTVTPFNRYFICFANILLKRTNMSEFCPDFNTKMQEHFANIKLCQSLRNKQLKILNQKCIPRFPLHYGKIGLVKFRPTSIGFLGIVCEIAFFFFNILYYTFLVDWPWFEKTPFFSWVRFQHLIFKGKNPITFSLPSGKNGRIFLRETNSSTSTDLGEVWLIGKNAQKIVKSWWNKSHRTIFYVWKIQAQIVKG